MFLSYNGYTNFIGCPFLYWHQYVNHTQPEEPDDRLGSIFGSVLGQLFEEFYRDHLWRDPSTVVAKLYERVERTVDQVITKETTGTEYTPAGALKWRGVDDPTKNPQGMYENRDELIADLKDVIPLGVDSIRHHRLLGPRMQVEHKLNYKLGSGHTLSGRADFIIQRVQPQGDLLIVDGKGSRHRDKYANPKQLHWYAMLFNLWSTTIRGPRLPDTTAFLFWRSPPSDSLDLVDVTQDCVDELRESAEDTIRLIQKLEKSLPDNPTLEEVRGVFTPIPNEQNCQFCKYSKMCPEGQKFLRL